MSSRKFRLPTLTALVLGACSLMAQAKTFTLNLNGTVANASYFSYDGGGQHNESWQLKLTGLPSWEAITVSQGDFVKVTINLDAPLTVQGSDIWSWYTVKFTSAWSSPIGESATTSALELRLAGSTVLSRFGQSCATSGSLVACGIFHPPETGPQTIDQAVFDFEVTALGGNLPIGGASFGYDLFSNSAPVPEPMSALLFGTGLGVLAVRRRKSN